MNSLINNLLNPSALDFTERLNHAFVLANRMYTKSAFIKQLAKILGEKPEYVIGILEGNNTPNINIIKKFAEELGVNLDWLTLNYGAPITGKHAISGKLSLPQIRFEDIAANFNIENFFNWKGRRFAVDSSDDCNEQCFVVYTDREFLGEHYKYDAYLIIDPFVKPDSHRDDIVLLWSKELDKAIFGYYKLRDNEYADHEAIAISLATNTTYEITADDKLFGVVTQSISYTPGCI